MSRYQEHIPRPTAKLCIMRNLDLGSIAKSIAVLISTSRRFVISRGPSEVLGGPVVIEVKVHTA